MAPPLHSRIGSRAPSGAQPARPPEPTSRPIPGLGGNPLFGPGSKRTSIGSASGSGSGSASGSGLGAGEVGGGRSGSTGGGQGQVKSARMSYERPVRPAPPSSPALTQEPRLGNHTFLGQPASMTTQEPRLGSHTVVGQADDVGSDEEDEAHEVSAVLLGRRPFAPGPGPDFVTWPGASAPASEAGPVPPGSKRSREEGEVSEDEEELEVRKVPRHDDPAGGSLLFRLDEPTPHFPRGRIEPPLFPPAPRDLQGPGPDRTVPNRNRYAPYGVPHSGNEAPGRLGDRIASLGGGLIERIDVPLANVPYSLGPPPPPPPPSGIPPANLVARMSETVAPRSWPSPVGARAEYPPPPSRPPATTRQNGAVAHAMHERRAYNPARSRSQSPPPRGPVPRSRSPPVLWGPGRTPPPQPPMKPLRNPHVYERDSDRRSSGSLRRSLSPPLAPPAGRRPLSPPRASPAVRGPAPPSPPRRRLPSPPPLVRRRSHDRPGLAPPAAIPPSPVQPSFNDPSPIPRARSSHPSSPAVPSRSSTSGVAVTGHPAACRLSLLARGLPKLPVTPEELFLHMHQTRPESYPATAPLVHATSLSIIRLPGGTLHAELTFEDPGDAVSFKASAPVKWKPEWGKQIEDIEYVVVDRDKAFWPSNRQVFLYDGRLSAAPELALTTLETASGPSHSDGNLAHRAAVPTAVASNVRSHSPAQRGPPADVLLRCVLISELLESMTPGLAQSHFLAPERRSDLRRYDPLRLTFGRLAQTGTLGCLLEFENAQAASQFRQVLLDRPPFRPLESRLATVERSVFVGTPTTIDTPKGKQRSLVQPPPQLPPQHAAYTGPTPSSKATASTSRAALPPPSSSSRSGSLLLAQYPPASVSLSASAPPFAPSSGPSTAPSRHSTPGLPAEASPPSTMNAYGPVIPPSAATVSLSTSPVHAVAAVSDPGQRARELRQRLLARKHADTATG